ncbi:MAG: group I intron-associated PD-(D/E)XK endonuclease [Streptosporangiaceae bacterium]
MAGKIPSRQFWNDSQLAIAVAASHSWRGVMRELGLNDLSAGPIRVVKRRAAELGLDTGHFRGQRRWSDAQLRRAVATAMSWDELVAGLGLAPDHGDGRVMVKAHARRLGLDLSRLEPPAATDAPNVLAPDVSRLRDAAAAIAAMWFQLCGCNTSVPLEPTVYDLLVCTPDGIKRVQVKTTTYNKGAWQVQVGRRPYSTGNRGLLVPYDPDAIDYFFILDGDLTMYFIPSHVLAGRVGILLRNYAQYIVGNIGSVLRPAAPAVVNLPG